MITFSPQFIQTRNTRNFSSLMAELAKDPGEERFGLVWGQAGRGKSRTVTWYHANNPGIYMLMPTVWRASERDFLRALCRELGEHPDAIPFYKAAAYQRVVELLAANPNPVFLDEIEKMSPIFLDIIRDLAAATGAPFILVGEEALYREVSKNRRAWSRVAQMVNFEAASAADFVIYARDTCGLKFSAEVANVLHKGSEQNFRLFRRNLKMLVSVLNSYNTTEASVEMAENACKMGFKAEKKGGE